MATTASTPAPTERSPKNANRSVSIGIRLLKVVADLGRAGTLSEIAQAAGMPASRTHRFLAGLIHAGAIRQDPNTGRYDVGPLLVDLGVAALGRLDGVQMGTDALKDVTRRTGFVSLLAIWGANGPTVIRWEHGGLGTAIRISEGQTLPLLRSSCGKLFLTYLPDDIVAPLVEAELASPAHRDSPSAIETMDDVRQLKEDVRKRGLATNKQEGNAGVHAVAAPVFGVGNDMTMAIAIAGVIGVGDLEVDGVAAGQLHDAAADLSRRLGATFTGMDTVAAS